MSTTMADISSAINQIDTKKQTLHQSFLHLQSHTPSSFNLPFNWSDLDNYFTTLQSSLQSKFSLLQTLNPSPDPVPSLTRPGLKTLCQNSDGFGLNRVITHTLDQEHREDQDSILTECVDAYGFVPDPGAMVLDVVSGFWSSGCLVMLEGLVRVKPVVSVEVKEKAMEIAVKWNEKRVCGDGDAKERNVLGFLLLVGAYGLVDRFGVDEIVDCFVVVAKDRKTVDLFRRIVPESNISDMIQKLIDKDMHVTAVNFSIALQKTKEFSPVGLLEERKLRSLRVIEDVRRNVKDLHVCNDVIIKEINTLKSIIECIEENNLQSEYPKDSVVELVNKLENEVENSKQALVNNLQSRKQPARAAVLKNPQRLRKQPSRVAVLKNQQQLKQQPARVVALKNQQRLRQQPTRAAALKNQLRAKLIISKKSKKPKPNKGQPTTESAAAAMPVQTVKLVHESRSQKSELSPDHVGECHNTPLGSGPTGSNAPYASSSASLDGSTRADTGYNFFVKQLLPPSDSHSNGWISD